MDSTKTIYMAGDYEYGATVPSRFANGKSVSAEGSYAHAEGVNSLASDNFSYVFNGVSADPYASKPYTSNGEGTFNINPVVPAGHDPTKAEYGVFVGSKSLGDLFEEYGGGATLLEKDNLWLASNTYTGKSMFASSAEFSAKTTFYGIAEIRNDMKSVGGSVDFSQVTTKVKTESQGTTGNSAASVDFVNTAVKNLKASTDGDIDRVKSAYLPLAGGTMTGAIVSKNIYGNGTDVWRYVGIGTTDDESKRDTQGGYIVFCKEKGGTSIYNGVDIYAGGDGLKNVLFVHTVDKKLQVATVEYNSPNGTGTVKNLVRSVNGVLADSGGDVTQKSEVWTFGLSDGSTVTKDVVLK